MLINDKTLDLYIDALKKNGLLAEAPSGCDTGSLVKKLSFDSRDVCEGTLFICKGAAFKPQYAADAAKKGAFCFISEAPLGGGFPCITVTDVRKAMAVCANLFCSNAFRSFPLIGLTGTKGKSTTLYYIKKVCEDWCEKNGLGPFGYISTIDTFDGKVLYESHLTTPEAPELAERFKNAAEAGVFAMGMEVSSQALKADRCYGMEFSIGAFMNFGIDHIGENEHPDEEDYLQSKLRIFDHCRTAVVNLSSAKADRIYEAAKNGSMTEKIITCSCGDGETPDGLKPDFRAVNIRKENGLTVFEIEKLAENGTFVHAEQIRLSMPGMFNAENALFAYIICSELGIPSADIADSLVNARAAGRMEFFEDKSRGISVIVDYAHNELSYERLFASCREEFPGKRIEIVFGCPGNKGLQRRVALPKVTAKYADYAYITEEDPFNEDPLEISKEVLKNLEAFGGKGEIIVDREECIKTAIEKAPSGTVIILAAKGRELYQHRGNAYVQITSDAELAERYVSGMK